MTYGLEKAIKFGESSSLVGIVTESAPDSPSDGKPAFIMLNSGILHHVGSCRLSVRTARALSASGYTSLRFDFSGIGDSGPRRDALPFSESSVLETREAMDYLARSKGIQDFVLMGLCSGADMAHHTAVVDDRVRGLMMLDAWAYRTLGHYWHHYGPKLLKWSVWKNSIGIRWRMLLGKDADADPDGVTPVEGVEVAVATYARVFPPRKKVESELRSFVDRGIRMYCVWTGGLPEYNHEGQYARSFRGVDFKDLLREEHLPTADHIITGLEHQDHLLKSVVAWAETV